METPAQMCTRLVAALEDLANQEAATLQARDFAGAIAIQDRAAPLVELLVAHAEDVTDASTRARIAAFMVKRNQTGEWLAEQMAKVREELQQTHVAQRRAAKVGPAYGSRRHEGPSTQLLAVG
jgi:hypothetical protein